MACGKAGLWCPAPDPGFGLVKLGNTFQPVLGDRSGAVAGDLKEFAPGMGPAIGKPDGRASPVGLDQAVVTGIAVHLQDAGEAMQNVIGILPAAPRRLGEGHARRGRATPRAIIPGQSPEVSSFGLACLRIKNRCPRFNHEQLGGSLQIGDQGRKHRLQLIGGLANPGREG